MKVSSEDVVTWIQADFWPQAWWGFDNGLGSGKCMEKECTWLLSKVSLTCLAASGISALPCSAADILYKLFPLSWYIKQLCSAAKKLLWSCLRKCDRLMESFPFSFRLWDDLSALCGKSCFFIWLCSWWEHKFICKSSSQGFMLEKNWFNGVFSNLGIKLLFILRGWNQSVHYLRTLQRGEKLRSGMVGAVNAAEFPCPGSLVWVWPVLGMSSGVHFQRMPAWIISSSSGGDFPPGAAAVEFSSTGAPQECL